MKGRVAKRNNIYNIQTVHKMTLEEVDRVTPADWQSRIRRSVQEFFRYKEVMLQWNLQSLFTQYNHIHFQMDSQLDDIPIQVLEPYSPLDSEDGQFVPPSDSSSEDEDEESEDQAITDANNNSPPSSEATSPQGPYKYGSCDYVSIVSDKSEVKQFKI